jgi:hypothetical protein
VIFSTFDGVCSWIPWCIWLDLEVHTFMEPLLFLIVDYLMEIFGGGDSLLYGGWSSNGLVLLSYLLPHNLAPSAKFSQGTKTSGTWKMSPLSPRQEVPSL